MYLSDALPPKPFEMNLFSSIMVFKLQPCTGFGKQVRRLCNKQFKVVYDGCDSQPTLSLKTKWHCLLNTLPIWSEN